MAQITLNSSGVASSGSLLLQTNGTTTQATLDTSGNLGLGVTPSAWASGFKTIQLGAVAAVTGAGTTANFSANQYWNGTNNIYLTSAAATLYQQSAGAHYWYNAPSGTAGNAITFTQAMTLDASGNLGIGATTITSLGSGYQTTQLQGANGSGFLFYRGASTQIGYFYGDSTGMTWATGSTTPLMFLTNNTERARIDSSGNLFIGTTSALVSTGTGKLNIQQTGNSTSSMYMANSATAFTSSNLTLGCGTTVSTSWNHIGCYASTGTADQFGTGVMFVRGNGNIVNTNNSYGAISDIKLKENITDATPKLAQLNQIRVVNYNFIGSEQKQLGVIAQEVEQIFPSVVEEAPDYENVTTTDEDGNEKVEQVATGTTTKSVKYSVFVPMLIKAIQEQQAIIETLTSRITALEAK